MFRTKVTRTFTLAGFASVGKLSHVSCGVLPMMALCAAAAAWGQTAPVFGGPHHRPLYNPATSPSIKPSASRAAGPQLSEPQAGPSYQFITINIPGATYAVADGINNDGLVSGYYLDSSSVAHGFVWQNGALRTVNYPGAAYTYLYNVNNQGVVIGYHGNGTTNHTVTYSVESRKWTALPDIPGYPANEGYGINDAGFAVGNAFLSSTSSYPSNAPAAWIWDPTTLSYSFFAVPGSAEYSTEPNGINDKGQVAGWYADSSGFYHGFLKEYGTYTTVDFPGAPYTFPDGLNNSGVIQGQILTDSYVAEGFTATSGGVFTVVNYPGLTMTALVGINDHGDVCGGYSEDSNPSVYLAFIALRSDPILLEP